jgi:hypothetical protein
MRSFFVAFVTSLLLGVDAFQICAPRHLRQSVSPLNSFFMEEKKATMKTESSPVVGNAEETTKRYGLEAGLLESVKSGDGESAKSLLKKYGIAYLATSIPLAIVSFAICYLLVDNGVDVSSLLAKVGIESSSTSETAGTVAIAYAAHKAASPIRFPPTVILTPIVAKLIGKEPDDALEE